MLDLTDQKRTEAEVCESEGRCRETELQLAHASRVAVIGQLSASIGHEINQPITAAVINAQTALRGLGADPPNLEEIRQVLGRIVKNSLQASAVIGADQQLNSEDSATEEGPESARVRLMGVAHGDTD